MSTSSEHEHEQSIDPQAELVRVLGELGDSDRTYVYRQNPQTTRWEYLGPADAGEPSTFLDRIRARWGGGDYRIQLYGTREDGTRGYIPGGHPRFSIAGPALDPDEGALRTAAPAAAPSAPSNRLESLISGLVESIREDRSARSDDMMRMMWEQQGRLLEAMIGRPSPDPTSDPAQILDVFLRGMELGQERTQVSGDPYDGVAARLLGLVQQVAGTPPSPAPGGESRSPPAGRSAAAAAPDVPDAPGHAARMLEPHLDVLLQAARARIPADDVARAVLEAATDEQIGAAVADPVLVDDIVTLRPALARYASWLRDVAYELEELYYARRYASRSGTDDAEPDDTDSGDADDDAEPDDAPIEAPALVTR